VDNDLLEGVGIVNIWKSDNMNIIKNSQEKWRFKNG
jgi:hypothetical protein